MESATYEVELGQGMDEWPYPDRRTWVFTHRDLPVHPGAAIVRTAADVGAVHGAARLTSRIGPRARHGRMDP